MNSLERLKNKWGRRDRDEKGFTLLELLIVVAITAVLMLVAMPVYGAFKANSKNKVVAAAVKDAYTAAFIAQQDSDPATDPIDAIMQIVSTSQQITFAYAPNGDGSFCLTASWRGDSTVRPSSMGECPISSA